MNMKTLHSFPPALRRAFTLVETLVVVSIIVLILALTGPTLLQTMQGNKLTSAGDSLLGAITEAQQLSSTLSTPVELRFYRYTLAPDSFEAHHAYQMFRVTTPTSGVGGGTTFEELFVALAAPVRLPQGVIIPLDSELGALLAGDGLPDSSDDKPNGNSGVQDATYVALRFMPDGTCRVVTTVADSDGTLGTLAIKPLNESYFTLCANIGRQLTVATLPKNFYTIQIDPFNSKARTYRPGQN